MQEEEVSIDDQIKSVQFRLERAHIWEEMETILNKMEAKGLSELSERDLLRLPVLYRAVISSYSVAKAISLDGALLDYLENLSQRAYISTYASPKRTSTIFADFMIRDLPKALIKTKGALLVSLMIILTGLFTGFTLSYNNEGMFQEFIDSFYMNYLNFISSSLEEESVIVIIRHLVIIAAFVITGFLYGIPTYLYLFLQGLCMGIMLNEYLIQPEFTALLMYYGFMVVALSTMGAGSLAIVHKMIFKTRLTNNYDPRTTQEVTTPLLFLGSIIFVTGHAAYGVGTGLMLLLSVLLLIVLALLIFNYLSFSRE